LALTYFLELKGGMIGIRLKCRELAVCTGLGAVGKETKVVPEAPGGAVLHLERLNATAFLIIKRAIDQIIELSGFQIGSDFGVERRIG
jgi:hypothetical protein